MPIVFRVLESAGPSESFFAYTGAEDQIGEPSVYGTVYRSYRSRESGESVSAGDRWIVKESKSVDYRKDFKFEYDVLRDLAQASEQQNGRAFSPSPVYLLERVDTGIPALAMPFYGEEVEREIYSWSQIELLSVMRDYVSLLIALKRVGQGYACTDRKQDDLRWHQGHLVVIDWNLLRDATPQYIQTEISIFGRLWYSMLTGRVPTATLNAFDDGHWQPVNTTDSPLIRDLLLGTRLIITRAVHSFYKSLDALELAIKTWMDYVSAPPQTTDMLQMNLQVSAPKAKALFVDLNPYHLSPDDFQAERRVALATATTDEDPLGNIQAALTNVGDYFSRGDFQSALAALGQISFENAVQRAAGERWRLLLSAAGDADAGERQDARQLAENWRRALDNLLNRPWKENIHAAEEPLARAEDAYRDSAKRFRGPLQTALLTLANEAKLRIEMLRVEQAMQRGARAVEALQAVDELKQIIPYAELIMTDFDLAARLSESRQYTETSNQLNVQVSTARTAILNWLQQWDTAEAMSSYDVLEAVKGVEQAAGSISGAAGHDVASRVLVYRQIVTALPTLREKPPIELVQFASAQRSRLDSEVAAVLDAQINRLIREQSQKVANRAEQTVRGIEQPTSENVVSAIEVANIYGQVTEFLTPEIAKRLSDEIRSKLNICLYRLESQNDFFLSLTNPIAPDTFDVLAQAQQAKVSIYHPAVWDYTKKALEASKNRQSSLTREYLQKAEELHDEVTRLDGEYRVKFNEQKKDLDIRIQGVKAQAEQISTSVSAFTPRIDTLEEQVVIIDNVAKQTVPRFIVYGIGALGFVALVAGIIGFVINLGNTEQAQELSVGATEVASRLAVGEARQSALESDVVEFAGQQDVLQATLNAAVMTISYSTPTPLPSPTESPVEITAEVTVEMNTPTDADATEDPMPVQATLVASLVKRYPFTDRDRTAFQPYTNETLITIPFNQLTAVELEQASPFQTTYEAIKASFSNHSGTLFLAMVDEGMNVIPVFKTENSMVTGYGNDPLPANSYSLLRVNDTWASYMPDIDLPQDFNQPLDVTLIRVDESLKTTIMERLGVRANYQTPDMLAPAIGDYVLALTSSNRLIEILWGQQLMSFARWVVTPIESNNFNVREGASTNTQSVGTVNTVAQVAALDPVVLAAPDQLDSARLNFLFSKNAIVSLNGTDVSNAVSQWWYLEVPSNDESIFGWARRDTFNLALMLDSVPEFPISNHITLSPLHP